MTREEAIEILKQFKKCLADVVFDEKGSEAWQMAIKALSQEPCTDAVSRQAVMEIIKAHMDGEDKNTKAVLSDVMDSVNELETFEQEPCDECRNKRTSFCGNCNEYDEFEPCDYAINRNDMMDAIGHVIDGVHAMGYREGYKDAQKQKSETVTEFADRCRECGAKYGKLLKQKSGKWIDYSDEGYVECPFCEHATTCEDNIDELHYCFYCGAKMGEPQESEDKE